jgi:hypothetical protein
MGQGAQDLGLRTEWSFRKTEEEGRYCCRSSELIWRVLLANLQIVDVPCQCKNEALARKCFKHPPHMHLYYRIFTNICLQILGLALHNSNQAS